MKNTIGLKRNLLDKFYTNPKTAIKCIQIFQSFTPVETKDILLEPSAGNGSFFYPLKQFFPEQKVIGMDIEPEATDIFQQDFLTSKIVSVDTTESIHVIGNPPFGRQSSLAIQFLKKACSFAKTVAFILPKSFKKDSMKKHIPLSFHLLTEIDLEPFSFLVEGQEHDVPCVFQIWELRDTDRSTPIPLVPNKFNFVKKDENPHLAFRRVGVNAGRVFTQNLEEKNSQSHYFVKFDSEIDISTVITKICKIVYPVNNTVGPKSISKQEIIFLWNPLMNE
jgi:predicted RNA methylase